MSDLNLTAAQHVQVAGWGGVPGECGAECSCGVTFDGFDDLASADAMLDRHIHDQTVAPVGLELSTADTVDAEVMPDPEPDDAQRVAAGLRQLAAMIEHIPGLVEITGVRYAFDRILAPVETRDQVAALARAGASAGARVTKHQGSAFAGVDLAFGEHVSLHVYADREQVCERIVVDTRQVTKEVPDPDALAAVPKVTVTEVEEIVEWRCHPLLADALPAGVS